MGYMGGLRNGPLGMGVKKAMDGGSTPFSPELLGTLRQFGVSKLGVS